MNGSISSFYFLIHQRNVHRLKCLLRMVSKNHQQYQHSVEQITEGQSVNIEEPLAESSVNIEEPLVESLFDLLATVEWITADASSRARINCEFPIQFRKILVMRFNRGHQWVGFNNPVPYRCLI